MNEPAEHNNIADSHSNPPDAVANMNTKSTWSSVNAVINRIVRIPGLVAILLVRLYQLLISPFFGRTCRFHPSCSQYYILAVRKYGLVRGSWKGTARICRCHPWNPGGYDPP